MGLTLRTLGPRSRLCMTLRFKFTTIVKHTVGVFGQKSQNNKLQNLTMLLHVVWGLYYMTKPNEFTPSTIGRTLQFTIEYYQVCTKISPWKGVKHIWLPNLIIPHRLFGVCTTCSCPMATPAQSQGSLSVRM